MYRIQIPPLQAIRLTIQTQQFITNLKLNQDVVATLDALK